MNSAIEKHSRQNKYMFPMAEVVAEALDFIREHEPPEGYFVGFSGGKDSIVTLALVREAGVKHQAFYSVTGIDPPEVVKFIRKEYPEVIWLKPKTPFYKDLLKKAPPRRMFRWCCNTLKKDPAKRARMREMFGHGYLSRIMGIRAEESVRRASRPRIYPYGGMTIYKPIFYWAEWHVWEFIESRGLEYPSLYDEGFGRIGCVVCPFLFGSPAMLKRNKERWPAIYRVFERVVKDWFDNHRTAAAREKYSAQTAEEYLAAYYEGRLICSPAKSEKNFLL